MSHGLVIKDFAGNTCLDTRDRLPRVHSTHNYTIAAGLSSTFITVIGINSSFFFAVGDHMLQVVESGIKIVRHTFSSTEVDYGTVVVFHV